MAGWKESKNPFLNELVIDNISKYLSFEELKVCRGLNHLWKRTTNRIFLKRCPPICLHPFYFSTSTVPDRRMMISEFMEIYSDPNHPHPYAQLLRQHRKFSVECLHKVEWIPIFYNFMTEVGPQITSLKLISLNVLRNSQDFMDIILSKYTPLLEELIVICLRESYNYNYDQSEVAVNDSKAGIEGKDHKQLRRLTISTVGNIQWLDVLSRYPKVKALSLSCFAVNELEEMATVLVSIRKGNETILKLTELEISDVRFNGYTQTTTKAGWKRIGNLLMTANLPLDKISLDGSTSEFYLVLFQHYVEDLKSLILEKSLPEPFPWMKVLEGMNVKEYSDLTFLTKVPNLKSLCFDPPHSRGMPVSFPESTPNPLLSLTEFNSDKEWNVTEMEQLLLWMPNVQNLKMRLDNTTFPWICQHFPNLKELTVLGEDLDDSGVVGEVDRTWAKACRPKITNLKVLKQFKMADSPVFNKGLTEKSVFYGFSRMPELSNLTINVKSELSGATMRALNRGIKNVRVKVDRKGF